MRVAFIFTAAPFASASPAFAECNTATQEIADCFPGAEAEERWTVTDEQMKRNEDRWVEEKIDQNLIADPDEPSNADDVNSLSAQ